eukprot:s44_g38.t1
MDSAQQNHLFNCMTPCKHIQLIPSKNERYTTLSGGWLVNHWLICLCDRFGTPLLTVKFVDVETTNSNLLSWYLW